MQLLRLTDVPPIHQSDQVFLYSRSRALLGAALLALSALGAFLFGWLHGAWPAYYIGAVALVVLLIFQKLITARFRPSNWLLRATDHGLYIKFRSYLNDHFDDRDLTVAFLPYHEIRSARALRQIDELPDREEQRRPGATTRTRYAVEIDIDSDSTALSKLLANERERIVGKSVIGAGRISTRYHHLPVRLAAANVLRIDWGVVPGRQILLDALARHTLVQPPASVANDYTRLETLSKEEQEARLLELVDSGDKIAAVDLARRLYSYDLTAAKRFVEELARRQNARKQNP